MDFGIAGKRAVVLASSRGLGLGVARALAAEGVDVLLSGRNGGRLADNCAAINQLGAGRAAFIEADLFDTAFADKMAAEIERRWGGVDIVINNSGGPTPGKAADMDAATLTHHFQGMVLSQISLANRMVAGMKARGFGRIVTIASSGVIEPIPNLALSNSLRPVLAGWSKTLASEVAAHGITVNMLLPGSIATDRLDELDHAASRRTGRTVEQVRAASEAEIPAKRYGRVEEFAAVAAFLCSAQASYLTGSMIRCDGGANQSL